MMFRIALSGLKKNCLSTVLWVSQYAASSLIHLALLGIEIPFSAL
jgi:hypothetical protein